MDPNTIDISIDEIIASFGAFYINEGQNRERLHMLPFEPFGTQSAGTLIPTDQTVLREANVDVQEILQQYQDDFTSKGGVDFKPVTIPLYNVKMDVGVIPHKLIASWLGFLTNNSVQPDTYPFIAWLIEEYLFKQKDEDLELKAIYKGVYEAPIEGVAGSADKVMDGIEKQLDAFVAAGDVAPITTGDLGDTGLSDKDMVTAVEDFVMTIPERYRYNTTLEISMNRTLRDKFRRGMREKYQMYYPMENSLTMLVDFENITVVGRASMIGKKRIWTTPKYNLLFPVKGFGNQNGFDIQKLDRKVKFLTDWWMGAGFVQPKLIFMNEQT